MLSKQLRRPEEMRFALVQIAARAIFDQHHLIVQTTPSERMRLERGDYMLDWMALRTSG
jgi:hypothetical protein